ncbi:hypothetical protein RBSWK_02757 [Rhodopirellula baltica SWK14]|uniref:Uncharacterized protein n=1 Tax=Rhodopirellula baltica SWK14 TaxID=993516 RepID=L7CJR2_RHOBT|nr:hypothetical protein RBSWK_02757 [Rhodopirellula baltica SWK14]
MFGDLSAQVGEQAGHQLVTCLFWHRYRAVVWQDERFDQVALPITFEFHAIFASTAGNGRPLPESEGSMYPTVDDLPI